MDRTGLISENNKSLGNRAVDGLLHGLLSGLGMVLVMAVSAIYGLLFVSLIWPILRRISSARWAGWAVLGMPHYFGRCPSCEPAGDWVFAS